MAEAMVRKTMRMKMMMMSIHTMAKTATNKTTIDGRANSVHCRHPRTDTAGAPLSSVPVRHFFFFILFISSCLYSCLAAAVKIHTRRTCCAAFYP
jgi:hypothetical protein